MGQETRSGSLWRGIGTPAGERPLLAGGEMVIDLAQNHGQDSIHRMPPGSEGQPPGCSRERYASILSAAESNGVNFLIVNQTKYMVGAHATTGFVNTYVNARLGNYGSAVRDVEVRLLYPPKRLVGPPTNHLDVEFRRLAGLSPRVTFFRAKRRLEIRSVCTGVSPRRIAGDGHLTLVEVTRLVAAVSQSLELARSRFRPADRFDYSGFLSDAQRALARCPGAIRWWLT